MASPAYRIAAIIVHLYVCMSLRRLRSADASNMPGAMTMECEVAHAGTDTRRPVPTGLGKITITRECARPSMRGEITWPHSANERPSTSF